MFGLRNVGKKKKKEEESKEKKELFLFYLKLFNCP